MEARRDVAGGHPVNLYGNVGISICSGHCAAFECKRLALLLTAVAIPKQSSLH